ncbi:MAG TPA: hypothetical protein VFV78_08115 [Vicinamibacterales bacterium]|nr:hypothetical protein [Vicinamibacterales bacterium]
MHSGRATTLVAALAAGLLFAGCNRHVDLEKVPVGTDVQLTRDDGGVVEGTLAARDAEIVKVKSDEGVREVPRDEIDVVQVVTPGKPVALPRTAKFREYIVPNGTPLSLHLDTTVSSETSRVGQPVRATLTAPVRVHGIQVLPAGSVVSGKVTVAKRAGNVKGRAQLAMHFDTVVANNERYPISAGVAAQARSTKDKDVAKIAFPAVGGAIIGGLLGGKKGAAAGAAIGGGAGTAVVLSTHGKPVQFSRGTAVRVRLARSVQVRVPVAAGN